MLDAGSAPEIVGDVTLFRDHQDPRRFYAMPEPPRPAAGTSGEPRVGLLVFRSSFDQTGGALLQMEVEVGLAGEQRRAIEAALAARGVPDPIVTEAPWIEGRADLLGWLGEGGAGGPEDRWIERRLATTTPSLLPGARAVFAARVDEAGASLLRGALEGGGIPAGVVYELRALGLMGPLGIEIDADLRAIHERLAIEGRLENQWVEARAERVLEELTQDRAIVVRVVDQSGDRDASRAEALRRAYEEILARLFQPAISPAPATAGVGVTAQYLMLGLALRADRDSLEERATFRYRERRTTRVVHRPQATLSHLAGDDGRRFVREVHTGDPFFSVTPLEVETLGRLADEGLGSLAVHVEWDPPGGAEDRPSPASPPAPTTQPALSPAKASLLLTDAQPRATATVPVPLSSPYRYRVEAHALAGAAVPPVRTTGERTSAGTRLLLSPESLFPATWLTLVAGRIDEASVALVELAITAAEPASAHPTTVSLRCPGDAALVRIERAVEGAIAGAIPAGDAEHPAPPAPLATVRATFRGAEGEPTWTTDPLPIDAEVMVIDAPFAPPLRIFAVPNVGDDIANVTLELVREEPNGFRHARTLDWSAPDRDVRIAVLRRLSATSETYRYRTTLLAHDGRLTIGEWIEATSPTLVLGDPDRELHVVRAVLLRGSPRATGDLAVEISIEPLDASGQPDPDAAAVRRLFEGDTSEAELPLMLPPGAPLRWTARVRRFRAGTPEAVTQLDGSGPLAVLDP